MKLFSKNEEAPKINLTLEQFKDYYKTVHIVSTESASDYLYKVKDVFENAKKRFMTDSDKLGIDAQNSRYEVEHVIKRLKFNDLKDYLVMKPENFKGKYVDYLKELSATSAEIIPATVSTVNHLKLAIASFINEYREDEIFTLYGTDFFQHAKKITDKTIETISKYFHNNNSTKGYVGDVLKTFGDLKDIHDTIVSVSNVLTLDAVKGINKLADEASSLIDSLIEQNGKTKVLSKNENAKKDLVDALYITAKQVECVSYLYANLIQFYAAYKQLTGLIIDVAKQE